MSRRCQTVHSDRDASSQDSERGAHGRSRESGAFSGFRDTWQADGYVKVAGRYMWQVEGYIKVAGYGSGGTGAGHVTTAARSRQPMVAVGEQKEHAAG